MDVQESSVSGEVSLCLCWSPRGWNYETRILFEILRFSGILWVFCYKGHVLFAFILQQNCVFCACKSTCSTKQARNANRGCPCKTEGVMCSSLCKCGSESKPCRNKVNYLRIICYPRFCSYREIIVYVVVIFEKHFLNCSVSMWALCLDIRMMHLEFIRLKQ